MASRRTVMAHDKRRNSRARKEGHKATIKRSQQQGEILARLVRQARAEAKAAA